MRHPTGQLPGKRAIAAILPAVAILTAGVARADSSVSLLHVARTLGFSYRYLQYENAVELIRPGGVIVVRPGDPFFTANGRVEPVNGMAPEYRNNDVYVSQSFASEIRNVGTAYRYSGPPVDLGRARHDVSGTVTDLTLTHAPTTNIINIAGHSTPGSPVTIVLKAAISEDLPLTVIDSVEATTDASGSFQTVMSTEPIHFASAHYIVEASSTGNLKPIVRTLVSPERNVDNKTAADSPP